MGWTGHVLEGAKASNWIPVLQTHALEDNGEMRILLVEDDRHVSQALERSFREANIPLVRAGDGLAGLRMAREGGFDCLLLDIMLPGLDGFQLLDVLRGEGNATPVIFLTARDGLSDRLRGLAAGGDYLVKPFAFSELLARLNNLVNRSQPRTIQALEVGDLTIQPDTHRVHRGGIRLDLTSQEYKLLELLARNVGTIVSRTRIAEELWDMEYDGDPNLVDAAVKRLRRKVDEPYAQRMIQTRRGIGYCLSCCVEAEA